MAAASGVRVGTGHAVFEADQVLVSGVGYRSAWAVCRPPYDDPQAHAALDDSDATATCSLILYYWRVPATVNSNAPRTLRVTVPRVLFHPIASTEAPDRKAILLAGSDGTIVTITVPLTVQPGDEAPVTAEVTEIEHLSVSGATCVASGDAGSIYLSTPGSSQVTVVALDADGTVITSTMNFASGASAAGFADASSGGGGGGRSSGGWVASTLLGLFGRGSGKAEESAASRNSGAGNKASADDVVRTIIARDECCFVETGSAIIAIDPTGDSSWRIRKESCRDRQIAELFDAAVTSTEIWLLVRPADASTAAIVTAPRDNAGGAAIVDCSFPLKSSVASSRAAAMQSQQQIRLHVGDGVNCTVINRTVTRHLCLASTVRAPQAEIAEPHPTGVFVFASAAASGHERLELLTNHGPLTMRRGAPDDLDASMASSAAGGVSGILDGSAVAMVDDRTPVPRGNHAASRHNMSLNLSSTTADRAIVQSPAGGLNTTAAPGNDTVASITSTFACRDRTNAQYNFAGVVAAANNSGADSAWSHASDDVATKLAVNPSNWAKGDLDDEDTDGIAFVTKELARRLQHHAALVDAVSADGGGKWAKLQPSTQALLLSRNEAIGVLLALRESFNGAAPGRDDARMKQFKLAVNHVAAQTRPGDAPHEASPSEVVFCNADSCAALLYSLNEAARADVYAAASLPLPARVDAAVANMDLWTAALDALDAVAPQHAHLADDSNASAMWTAHHREDGFLGALVSHCHLIAELLRNVVDAAVVDSNTNEAALHLTRCLERSLSTAMRLGRSADLNARLLSGSLFREPFYAGRIGYPHGAPTTNGDSPIAIAADEAACRLATEHAVLPVLFALSASERLDWDRVSAAQTPEDIPEWGRLRHYVYAVPGFFAHVMEEFIEAYREAELEALPRVVPGRLPGTSSTRVEDAWKAILERRAPDMLWMMEPTCDTLITASRAYNACRVPTGDSAAEHRSNTLTLANLALLAQHEPLAPRRRLHLENLCADAQKKHLPQHANRALACDELVRLLLEEQPAQSSSAWEDASKLAAAAPSDQQKHDLSMRVLCSCFKLEGPQVIATAADQETGDAARIQQLDASHTGRAVLANPILHRLVNAESEQVVSATDAAFAGALRAWSAAKYR